MKKSLLPLLTLLAAQSAFACKLAATAYDLDAFLKDKRASQVVFLATVTATRALPDSDNGHWQEITFQPSRWWRGKPQQRVLALGLTTIKKTHTCSGQFDFSAKKGEQWFIVGNMEGDRLHPSHLMSELLRNGKVPRATMAILDANPPDK
jgi:hypothetical protein